MGAKPIKFDIQLTDDQKEIKSTVLETPVNFIIGKEGTGKTMLGVNIALDLLFRKDTMYDKIIISRPTITTEDFGYLPGGIDDKLAPFLAPIYENIKDVYGGTEQKRIYIRKHFERQSIRILPIAFTRGVSYNNAVVLIDEFQNCTRHQLEMIIGRLGKTSKLIFTGSGKQIDLKNNGSSGITLVEKIKDNPYVSVNTLTTNHRHEAVESILNCIRDEKL